MHSLLPQSSTTPSGLNAWNVSGGLWLLIEKHTWSYVTEASCVHSINNIVRYTIGVVERLIRLKSWKTQTSADRWDVIGSGKTGGYWHFNWQGNVDIARSFAAAAHTVQGKSAPNVRPKWIFDIYRRPTVWPKWKEWNESAVI